MISPFFANDKQLHLSRFPQMQVNRSLQAWDATDEYLLSYLEENGLLTDKNILIFNDSFGALTLTLSQQNNSHCYVVSDSYISHQGIDFNAQLNQLDTANIEYLTSLSPLPEKVDIILYRIPKSKSLLTEQLIQIKQNYNSDVLFIAGAKVKEIHTSTLNLFEKYLGTTQTSLALKKARLVFSQLDQTTAYTSPFPTKWQLENSPFTISNHANVFAREKLDLGARFFLAYLPELKAGQKVIDLGCGNGVVGLMLLAQQPNANISFVDESFMAVASAKENIAYNLAEQQRQCQFLVDDCLTSMATSSIDVIVCNPPFHQQQATTDHIAWQMFNDAFRVLKNGGELRIIGNRNLAYHIKLKRIFGNVKTVASNQKFVILSAKKNEKTYSN